MKVRTDLLNAVVVTVAYLLAKFSKGKQKFKGDTPKGEQ